MDTTSGYYDEKSQAIYPVSTSTWSGLSGNTWSAWNQWAYATNSQIIWMMPMMFMGNNPSSMNLSITCSSTGLVSYKVYTSDLGAFSGEETETVINQGATLVPPFKSKYMMIIVYATAQSTSPLSISEITVNTTVPKATEYIINDLDSSTCAGSSSSRQIPLPGAVGAITDIQITPREVTAYALDLYVSSTATSTYVIPKVISKNSTTPTFALVGLDNKPRDAVVDIVIKSLSYSQMSGNNLIRS